MKSKEFLKSQKILRLATVDCAGNPYIVPVWYKYINGKFYIGTNTRTRKAKNIKKNPRVSFCIDIGVKSPNIIGMMGTGTASLIMRKENVQLLAKKILLRYFKNLKSESAQKLLNDTNCVIKVIPKKITKWQY